MAELLTTFMAAGADEAPQVYADVFLNVECATVLLQQSTDSIIAFINKALTVVPPWSSTRAAVRIKELINVNFVSGLKKANHSYLYSIALAARLDPGYEFELDPQQAEVAFGLSEAWLRAAGRPDLAVGAAAAPLAGVPPVGAVAGSIPGAVDAVMNESD